MYLDSIVVLGLVIVVAACVMLAYVAVYAYKHIKADAQAADQLDTRSTD